MLKKLFRLSLAAAGLALVVISAKPAQAAGCPEIVVIWGSVACHRVAGSSCEWCVYYCPDINAYAEWYMCGPF